MDLIVVSTGEYFYKCDDGCAKALLAAFPESFKRIERAAPPALPTYWTYFCGPTNFGAIAVQRKRGATTEMLRVAPEDVKKYWPECPDSVIALYQMTPAKEHVTYA